MERKKASDFPQELLNLFDRYVHGGISRRQFLDGAQKFAVGGVTAAALLQMLKPNYAWAIQVPPDDKRIRAETRPCRHRRAMAASRAIWCDRQMKRNYPRSSSSTKIAASTRISKMWRGGWRSLISSPSRQMRSPPWAAIPVTARRAWRCSSSLTAAK